MKQKEFLWHIICYDDYHLDEKKELINFLDWDFLKDFLSQFDLKVIVVLWWDWTMLRAIKEHYNLNIPFLWINFWHKWFLLNSKDVIYKNMSYIQRKYPILEIDVKIWWVVKKSIAVNEIDIRAWNWKMISLDISLLWKQSINIEWDWIIVSTPAWSTWYNSSLWWPIIPHTLNAFVITPKAPWKPKWQSSVLINNTEVIHITNVWRRVFTEIYCDWKEFLNIQNWDQITFNIKKSDKFINLIISKDYQNIWDNKVLQEQWFY